MLRRSTTVLVAVALVVLAACSGSSGGSTDGTTIPVREGSILQPLSETPADGAFALYWMRDCAPPEKAVDVTECRLVAGERRPTSGPDRADELVRALMAGPNETERAAGLSTNIRDIAVYDGLTHDGDLVTVRFNRFFETAKTRPQVAQVVYTLTQLPDVKRVQILVDGTPNGAVGATPQDRVSTDEFLGPLFVDRPAMDVTVSGSFAVRGSVALPAAGGGPGVGYRIELPDGTASPAPGSPTTGASLGSEGSRAPYVVPAVAPPDAHGPATLVVFRTGPDGAPVDEQRVPIILAGQP